MGMKDSRIALGFLTCIIGWKLVVLIEIRILGKIKAVLDMGQ